jgi:hypothetical protein
MERRRIAVTVVGAVLACSQPPRLAAHDIYSSLRDRSGYQCCGGEDCEAVGSDFVIRPDGSVVLLSRRQHAWIAVAQEKITWLVVPGGEKSEAHWCGRRRGSAEMGLGADQADATFWTYCTFLAPQGS